MRVGDANWLSNEMWMSCLNFLLHLDSMDFLTQEKWIFRKWIFDQMGNFLISTFHLGNFPRLDWHSISLPTTNQLAEESAIVQIVNRYDKGALLLKCVRLLRVIIASLKHTGNTEIDTDLISSVSVSWYMPYIHFTGNFLTVCTIFIRMHYNHMEVACQYIEDGITIARYIQ